MPNLEDHIGESKENAEVSLENTLGQPRQSFGQLFRNQIREVGYAYLALIKNPTSIPKGVYYALEDVVYKPIAFVSKAIGSGFRRIQRRGGGEREQEQIETSREEQIKTRIAQSLAIGELFEVPASIGMTYIFQLFGVNKYIAGTIGGTIGDYISVTLGFCIAYLSLSRSIENYSVKDALIQCGKTVRNMVPVHATIYTFENLHVFGLMKIGLGAKLAQPIKYLSIGLLVGVGREVSVGERKYVK